ncbi:MAG: CBS domain-containing protein [Nitrososphaeria archaeon]|nr:CBS domain-containing protein [Nitrosopumilaceae archaeon]NIP09183.1 CBS domain-containing protein [Nitrosopumilaceae archaeon]NIP91712.1 CBS domain-containing protein [Nitrososphaeria archaeon]NIS95551.1 CBS domain-containing protein [Nitrosopumilaceae archaeon]
MERKYSKSVITVNPDSSVYEALEKMQSNSIKRVVICENTRPLGIITERDINKFLESDKTARALDEILVKHLMEKNVVLITDKLEDDFYQCASKMDNFKIGSIIITDKNGNLSGIISRTDLVKSYANVFGGKYLVKDFMTKQLVTCRKTDRISFALDLMNQNKVSRLVVTDENGSPIGLVSTNTLLTHSDYFSKGTTRSRDYLLPLKDKVVVNDLLEENLVTINEDEDLAEAARKMIKSKISGIPVIDSNQKLVGVVSKTDVVKAFSDVVPHEKLKQKYEEIY